MKVQILDGTHHKKSQFRIPLHSNFQQLFARTPFFKIIRQKCSDALTKDILNGKRTILAESQQQAKPSRARAHRENLFGSLVQETAGVRKQVGLRNSRRDIQKQNFNIFHSTVQIAKVDLRAPSEARLLKINELRTDFAGQLRSNSARTSARRLVQPIVNQRMSHRRQVSMRKRAELQGNEMRGGERVQSKRRDHLQRSQFELG